MFELDDDFEIDEEFLNGVFSVEQEAKKDTEDKEQIPLKKRRSNDDVVPVVPINKNPPEEQERKCTASRVLPRSSVEAASSFATENHYHHSNSRSPFSSTLSNFSRNASPNEESFIPETAVSNVVYRDENTSYHKTHPAEFRNHDKNPWGNFSGSERSNSPRRTFNSTAAKVRQRKFPGPAGLLPERAQRASLTAINSSVCEVEEEEPLCSQSVVSLLDDGPWLALKADLAKGGQDLLNKYTVAWVKRKSAARQLVGQKVPFLAAVMHSLDCSSPDPCIVLRDSTGEIPGTLHRSVWEKFGGQLMVGSALVLRLVGVLSTGIAARRHYLNITGNNIVTIYSSGVTNLSVDSDPLPKSQVLSSGGVRTTPVHKLTVNDLWQTVSNWEEQSRNYRQNSSSAHNGGRTSNSSSSHPLFNTVFPNQNSYTSIKRGDVPSLSLNRSNNCNQSNVVGSISSLNNRQTLAPNYHTNPPLPVTKPATRPAVVSSQSNGSKSDSTTRAFVPKKPSFFSQSESQNSQVQTSVQQENNRRNNTGEISLSLNEFDDDLEISSVLDGIDSDSLFGEF